MLICDYVFTTILLWNKSLILQDFNIINLYYFFPLTSFPNSNLSV